MIASQVAGSEWSASGGAVARTSAAISSADAAATGDAGGGKWHPISYSIDDQGRRELFGAAAFAAQPRQGSGGFTVPRGHGGAGGATGDIPESVVAGLPPTDDPAATESLPARSHPARGSGLPPAATADAPHRAGEAPLRLSPATPRPRSESPDPSATPPATASAAPVQPPERIRKDAVGGRAGVAEAQRLLAILGYAPGTDDGVAGKQTRAAVLAYRKAAGLPATDDRIDAALLSSLRRDLRSAPSATESRSEAEAAPGRPPSLTERIMGGMQHLIGRDLDSVRAPAQLAEYCTVRSDEWIYDWGLGQMRLCGDVNGAGRVAYRPLPGDR
ncbi:MAG: peptidoglycan-binding domain-containing protein [Rhodospirillales bacterium]